MPSIDGPNHAPAGYRCPFCAYVAGGEDDLVQQRHVVERTTETLTFISPKWWVRNEGAVLVVPHAHIENLYGLPDSLGVPLLRATRRAAVALRKAYGAEGTSTRQHNEPAGNQDVWHFHTHVFPRHPGDDLYRSPSRWASGDEMARRADVLREAYAQLDLDAGAPG